MLTRNSVTPEKALDNLVFGSEESKDNPNPEAMMPPLLERSTEVYFDEEAEACGRRILIYYESYVIEYDPGPLLQRRPLLVRNCGDR